MTTEKKATYVPARPEETILPPGEEELRGWIHRINGLTVELYLEVAGEERICTLSRDFLEGAITDLEPGTAILLAIWQEEGQTFFQFRQTARRELVPEGSPPPPDWVDQEQVDRYLQVLREHFGETGEEGD